MASVIRYSLIKIDTLILLKMSNMPGIEEFTPEFFIQSSEAWMKINLEGVIVWLIYVERLHRRVHLVNELL
ncbi:MAG: hypothetical protein EBU66_15925 [Bacteroidetes bacterium]|nr:hypothetical protein [Bacteroidota bacterium]